MSSKSFRPVACIPQPDGYKLGRWVDRSSILRWWVERRTTSHGGCPAALCCHILGWVAWQSQSVTVHETVRKIRDNVGLVRCSVFVSVRRRSSQPVFNWLGHIFNRFFFKKSYFLLFDSNWKYFDRLFNRVAFSIICFLSFCYFIHLFPAVSAVTISSLSPIYDTLI